MKTLNPLKVPFGTAKGVALRGVRYLQWEDAFEVDFVDGLTFLEPHATIRKANKISNGAKPVRVELEEELNRALKFIHAHVYNCIDKHDVRRYHKSVSWHVRRGDQDWHGAGGLARMARVDT